MRITGIALIWIGVIALLKNIGIIQVVDWSIIWPVILIIAGSSFKRGKHGMMCGMGGKCGMCKGDEGHKCEGPNCKH
ncbi:MAG: hypothetical protein HZB11_01405 [Candidatus Yonathbacteria bacterium]|nr:hypothetical protein [Candidatus Yonathbacteria bacterium]